MGSASTHRQALAALIFLYKQVLEVDLPWLQEIGRPRAPQRLPVVMSRAEVHQLLAAATGEQQLVLLLLYGTGMRKMGALRLRVKDVDFERRLIVVREGKGKAAASFNCTSRKRTLCGNRRHPQRFASPSLALVVPAMPQI